MLGDIIHIEEKHLETAEKIYQKIIQSVSLNKGKISIGIGGESGSGKSVTAFALQKFLEQKNISSLVFQQDDYFFLPPKSNHEKRVESIKNVGVKEVNLALISKNIQEFKAKYSSIKKPLVNYSENLILEEICDTENTDILIVEGTYILELPCFDFTIFIDRNYKDTYENRLLRNREKQSDFIEEILEIEHTIIRELKSNADLIINKNYEIL